MPPSLDDIILTAASPATADDGSQFEIGATLADTVTNLRAAILSNLSTRTQTTLAAASSVVASESFFAAGPNTPPQRVDFTPPATAATATSLRDDAADTVTWYIGDDDPSVTKNPLCQQPDQLGHDTPALVRVQPAGEAAP